MLKISSSPGRRHYDAQPSMEPTPRSDDRIALPDGRWLAYAEFGDPDGRPVLFMHATPGYRLNPWATDAALRSAGVRLIAPDRPGVGRSSPQPRRRLLDWPDDVRHLADALHLERFGVVGFSNGGPHAAACTHRLGPQVSGTALVAPLPPLDAPGAARQFGVPRWYYPLARRAPWLLRALYAGLAALARRNPRRAERLLVGGMSQADQRLFGRPELAAGSAPTWPARAAAAWPTTNASCPCRGGLRPNRSQGRCGCGSASTTNWSHRASGWTGPTGSRSARRPWASVCQSSWMGLRPSRKPAGS
jgi:pimeloyl-ACP methyl ester carboxylesterase